MDKNTCEWAIQRQTRRIPGVIRDEIYTIDDMVYIERFDDNSGERLMGELKMYDDTHVGYVSKDGRISLSMPTGWVTNHDDMMKLMKDIERLDKFIGIISKEYL